MNNSWLLIVPTLLYAHGLTLDDVNGKIEECKVSLQQQVHEMDLFHQRLADLEKAWTKQQHSVRSHSENPPSVQKTLESLQKGYRDLVSDIITLKTQEEKLSAEFNKRISALEKLVTNELRALHSLVQQVVEPESSPLIHVVQKGDSLSKLAIQYKTSIQKLKELNAITSNTLVIGQKLKIPYSSNNA